MTLQTELPKLCRKQVYFHNRENHEEESGIYTVASFSRQDPETGTVLIFREKQQAWVEPEFLQFEAIDNIERIVLMAPDEEEPQLMKFQFRSMDVASLLLRIANDSPKYTEEQATSKAMEWLAIFLLNKEWTNDGCTLMKYRHWKEQYTGNNGEIL